MTHRWHIRFPLALVLALACVPLVSRAQTRPADAPAGSSKFMRFVPDDHDGGILQTSVVTYRNSTGASVDLIAAVHVADARFYHELDQSFAHYDSVLYELVKPRDYTPTTHPAPRRDQPASFRSLGWVGLLQQFLKNQLGLTFQLEEIDYSRPNFVHADLDSDTFFRMQEDRGESMLTLMLQTMLRELAREKPGNAYEPGLGDLLLAMQSPDRPRQLKLILARQFDQMEDMLAGLGGPDGTVILDARNRAAIKALKQQLAKGDKTIGIFYGAGHLKGMETILTTEMGFHQVGDPAWHTAWDMTTPAPTTRP